MIILRECEPQTSTSRPLFFPKYVHTYNATQGLGLFIHPEYLGSPPFISSFLILGSTSFTLQSCIFTLTFYYIQTVLSNFSSRLYPLSFQTISTYITTIFHIVEKTRLPSQGIKRIVFTAGLRTRPKRIHI